MELRTYYDFANDDYKFLKSVYESKIFSNSFGAITQNTCERFLKHLIDSFIPVSKKNRQELTEVLSTHNLNRLVSYWNEHTDIAIDEETIEYLRQINGYYFSTKYPGDDAQTLNEDDIHLCMLALEKCKRSVDLIITAKTLNEL